MNKPVLSVRGLSWLVWCHVVKELHYSLTPSQMSNTGDHQELVPWENSYLLVYIRLNKSRGSIPKLLQWVKQNNFLKMQFFYGIAGTDSLPSQTLEYPSRSAWNHSDWEEAFGAFWTVGVHVWMPTQSVDLPQSTRDHRILRRNLH